MLSKRITSSLKSRPPLSEALRAAANTSLITMQHVDFEKKAQLEHRDADGYPLDGVDEVDGLDVVLHTEETAE